MSRNGVGIARKLDSFVHGYIRYTEGISSPELFRKWSAIVTIGACLERRVWTITAKKPTFPNMFVVLIGPPGIGKSEAINGVRSLVRATGVEGLYEPSCNLAPVDVTKASLYDYLQKKSTRREGPDPEATALDSKETFHYHSAFLAVTELSDLIRDHDTQLLGALHGLYDCLPMVEEERRYRADNPIKIQRPQVSLLGGTTPAYINRTFPPSAWDEGFMARTILIYSSEVIMPDLFGTEHDDLDPLLGRELVEDLRAIGKMWGRFEFSDQAKKTLTAWQKNGQQPRPAHMRLEHYNTRRMRHAIKLSMIAAANRSNGNTIDVEDFQEALSWMVEAEEQMPKIFLDMVGKSDGQVMNECYMYVRGIFDNPLMKNQPVKRSLIINFLRNRVPAYGVEKVLEMMVESEMLIKCVTTVVSDVRYKPGDKPGLFKDRKR